jgi:hypothetical protein
LISQWFKNRWLEARWGLLYTSFIVSFTTFTTVTYTDIPIVKQIFANIAEYAIFGFILGGLIISPTIGHLHGKHQQSTDVLKANEPLLQEIRKI